MGRETQMNSITSAEKLAQVNRDNTQLLNDFLDYLRSVQRSEMTIFGYQNDIQIAWVWCLEHNDNKPFIEWTKRNVIAYQNWLLNTNNNSPARVRRLKAALCLMLTALLLTACSGGVNGPGSEEIIALPEPEAAEVNMIIVVAAVFAPTSHTLSTPNRMDSRAASR